jgi:DNA-damage-inducible protein J
MVASHNHEAKNAAIQIRINRKIKVNAEHVLKCLGLTMSQAINMYLIQIITNEAIPFAIEVPNRETANAIREAKAKKGLIKSKNINDLFTELDIDK